MELNKMKGRVILLPGDIKKVAEKLSRRQAPAAFSGRKENRIQNGIPRYFDVIAMPRPQLRDSFLKEAFSLSKKGTRIYYYDFCKEDEIDLVIDKVKNEAKKNRKKIKILNVKKAGNISPYRYRIRVDFRVL
ncbi:MAG: hypothetical protein M1165_02525 [Candidatus Pacearchaeota archaeon]|nr:hypothetical protein [Candidatus Pacearchaeota archaeon]